MARASIATLLSLDRFAKVMGINPAHFNQAEAPSLNPAVFPLQNSCSDLWHQYDWQTNNQVSREEIARKIRSAEDDLENILNYPLAQRWIAGEMHQYPRHYNRQGYGNGLNVRGQMKSIQLKTGKFIQGGRRNTSLVGTATTAGGTLVYSDDDGDGLNETATITLTTSLTDACEIKVYFAGNDGDEEWEVRPVRSKSISGGNITIVLDSWLLINPDLWEQFPTVDTNPSGVPGNSIDISSSSNFVTSVDVYREFNDFTQVSAVFFWERDAFNLTSSILCNSCSGAGCQKCTLIAQNGCLHVRDVDKGIVVPVPATYNLTTEQWDSANWGECKEPNQVKVWYQAGDISNDFQRGKTCDTLSEYWAETITWLAVAKTDKPFCSCPTVDQKVMWLQEDLSRTTGNLSFFVDTDISGNPFGTRRGAIMAWLRVSRFNKKEMRGYAV